MEVMNNAAKKDLYELVDALPESELKAARRYLEFLKAQSDPVQGALAVAPYDDEDATWDDEEASKGRADAAAGRVLSTDALKAELGLE